MGPRGLRDQRQRCKDMTLEDIDMPPEVIYEPGLIPMPTFIVGAVGG